MPRSLSEILRHLDSRAGKSTEWVVQRYLDRPLLLRGGRKFDMRLWVLLDHNYHMYLYRQGVLRTGSVPFSMDNLDDRFVHLSNHCIQVRPRGGGVAGARRRAVVAGGCLALA